LKKNNTWVLSKLSKNCKAIRCKWLFQTKRNAQGEIVHHKARLVAKGCMQKHGFDFNDTFAPVVKLTSTKVLLAIAAL
jgi:hypothetical protein